MEVKVDCINCGEIFTMAIDVQSGDVDTIFCSDKCGIKFYENETNR